MKLSNIENSANFKEKTELDRAKKALRMAKRLEEKRLSLGWKYINATPNIQVLVPCKKDGTPTEDGQRRIDEIINR
jgi:hypothetical protein